MISLGVSDSSAKTLLVARSTNTRAVSLPRSNTDFTRADRTMSRSALTTASSDWLWVGGRLRQRIGS
jgi:hypothetical protein